MTRSRQSGTLLLLLTLTLLSLSSLLHAAQSPFDIDVKELDQAKPSAAPKAGKKTTKKAKPAAPAETVVKKHKAADGEAGYVRYTVKPGDHIFKILVVRFGMSNEAAEKLIPEIIRINDITNIKKLTVGRTLLIPSSGFRERAAKPAHQGKARVSSAPVNPAPIATAPAPAAPNVAEEPAEPTWPTLPAPPTPAAKAPTAPFPAPTAIAPPAVTVVPTAPAVTVPRAPTVAAPAPAVPAPAVLKSAAPMAPVPPATASPSAKAPAEATLNSPAMISPPAEPAVAAPARTMPLIVAPAPAAPLAKTWVCSVTEKDPAKVVDSVMNALALHWSRNRIIQSDDGAPTAFSIRVDRYFELKGARYIVSIGESDPYSYTLLRLLESAGYRVLMINSEDDFLGVGEKLLRFVGLDPNYGRHVIQGGKESAGFLVQDDDEGRQVVITNEAVDPKLKWTMPPGCAAR